VILLLAVIVNILFIKCNAGRIKGGGSMKEWSDEWLLREGKRLGLRVMFVPLDDDVVSAGSHENKYKTLLRHEGQG
jgi:hypothetical protein